MAPSRPGRRFVYHVLTLVVILCATALGLVLYFDERDTRQQEHSVGDTAAADGVLVETSVQKVDPVARELTLRVLVLPGAGLRRHGDPYTPAADLVVETSSLIRGSLEYRAGRQISYQDLKVSLDGASVSDYPFDSYRTEIGFAATAGGREVPVAVSMRDVDAFFKPAVVGKAEGGGYAVFDVRVSRSRATFIMAWFMMLVMWGLALAVLGASWVIIDQRRGLVWPAMGWMAATLFALAGFRNAAPGGPPIGCLLDYAAFLWAEAIISASLVAVAVTGILAERGTTTQEAPEVHPDHHTDGHGAGADGPAEH
ncbi:DUF4436 family protein [Streptomyces melanogenes]|uniref:DUF4436 family protein n=1 Tax=Streptomyces melanogenes TaxID=67326 RepID=UPI00167D3A72|nr:DUF4436 family protein [Streptomyces melanogenes]GGP90609.1 hypothetical protein GCM10010278_81170 [Streptomyces melanogenes]